LYERKFEREPDATGFAYWSTGEGEAVPFDLLVLALLNGADVTDRIASSTERLMLVSKNLTEQVNQFKL
jgi:hypothetical protein